MLFLLKQELYKLFHKKSTYANIIIQMIFMLSMALLSIKYNKIFNQKSLFLDDFTGELWSLFVLIYLSSTILLKEFSYGTIKLLISKNFSRLQIYLSKIITVFIYSLIMFAVSIIFSVILKITFFDFNLTGKTINLFIQNNIAQFFTTWLIISFVFALSILFKASGVALSLGIIVYFASAIAANFMFGMIKQNHILKYNPINLMNFSSQIDNPLLKQLTLLSNTEYIVLIIVYVLLFLTIGNYLFKKRTE